jgi:hypothetical protein
MPHRWNKDLTVARASTQTREGRVRQIARDLALILTSQTASQMAERSGPPKIEEVSWRPVTPTEDPSRRCLWVVEGETIEVTARVTNYDQAFIHLPGVPTPRPYREGESVHFQATVLPAAVAAAKQWDTVNTGVIRVTAMNALNDGWQEAVASPPLRVLPVPQVNPYTFDGVEVHALSKEAVAELVEDLAPIRQFPLDYDAGEMAARTITISDETRAVTHAAMVGFAELVDTMADVAADGVRLGEHFTRRLRPPPTDWLAMPLPPRLFPVRGHESVFFDQTGPTPAQDDD